MRLDRRFLTLVLGGFLAACSNGMRSGGDGGDARSDTSVSSDTAPEASRDVVTNTDAPSTDAPASDVSQTDGTTVDAPSTDAPAMDVQSSDVPVIDVPIADVPVVDAPGRDVGMSRACGGRLGATCGTGEFCSYAIADMCGAADQNGVCQPIPTRCAGTMMPVCGCDGMTYNNECEANRAGTSAASSGACTTPGDCRTTSCPRGEYCAPCRGVGGATYVCLPVGAVC